MFTIIKKLFGTAQDRTVGRYRKIVDKINTLEEGYQKLSDAEVKAKTGEFMERFRNGATTDDLLPEAFAVVKNVCRRLIGTEIHISGYNQRWDMVPYDVQLIGGIAMHNQTIAEMQTGEGKTLTATMPLYLHALTGRPVHIVTVNDYLATRDCAWMGAIFRWLGLTAGALTNDMSPNERRELYRSNVLYGTASEFGFDYLRDNALASSRQQQVQGNDYYFVIVDEIDSILIDEARTPLIISGPVPESKQMYEELKGDVDQLVKAQRNLCNRLANEARKTIESADETVSLTKEQNTEISNAYHKLWLVSKGMPRNRTLKRILEDPNKRARIDEWELFYHADQNKKEKPKALAELYIIVDERSNEYELTDKGIGMWEQISNDPAAGDPFTMLDLSSEYIDIDSDSDLSEDEKIKKKAEAQERDAQRKERSHNIRQLLHAHLLMEHDVDYIIHDNKIVIIDENTGRPQPGRRFSNGLHQAIEAKENVAIQRETQTYATVTLQNFFRMYERIAGMTGTAITEANEFREIYKLDVLQIPSHKKCARVDANDEVYMSEREKYNAVLKEVRDVHSKGRPILIGTESVDISEKLSRIFRQNNLPHTVLNAKQPEREADIIANAGAPNAITISTNMAGRGTDIKLQGNVADIGGLHVIGTTRHQSRRIDRQLRGRCARQGDPGSSKFYVSFEDSLMRLFASPKITNILQRFRPPEGEPISAGILDKAIETAQKRVEQRNYVIRKHTLQYDDVMNKQRKEVYAFRNKILHSDDIRTIAHDLIISLCSLKADNYFVDRRHEGGWDTEGYTQWLTSNFPIPVEKHSFEGDTLTIEDIEEKAAALLIKALDQKASYENSKVDSILTMTGNEGQKGNDYAADAIRQLMIRKIDQLWQEHLLAMDHLRSEVHLHAIAQKDPLIEFKHQAFTLFDQLRDTLQTSIAADIFKFKIVPQYEGFLEQRMAQMHLERSRSLFSEMQNDAPVQQAESSTANQNIVAKPVPIHHDEPQIHRNDPCPCGSGKKYKKCCGTIEGEE